MNMRFVIVGIVLAIVVTLAVIIGSPALGGFDSMRWLVEFSIGFLKNQ